MPLGSAFPESQRCFRGTRLARYLGSGARHMDPWSTVESLPPGSAELRRQIARRYLRYGATCLGGRDRHHRRRARSAQSLAAGSHASGRCHRHRSALRSTAACRPSRWLGLKAVEIPTDPREGIDLGALAQAIERHGIRACWLMTTFQNPLGATMPEAKKRELVQLLEKHGVPLIEDDVYAELYFGEERPRPAKAFESKGGVLNCGSFSKCLAPGYRLGWVAAGRFAASIQRRKIATSISTSLPIQDGIALFLKQEGYDSASHHACAKRLPLSRPRCSPRYRSTFRTAIASRGRTAATSCGWNCRAAWTRWRCIGWRWISGISVAPGPIFSPRREFRNCLRLNAGHPWTPELDRAIATLGQLASSSSSS